MRVAIVHHWFVSAAGGERVVDTIGGIYPDADIFTLFLDRNKLPPSIRERRITSSILDFPVARKAHRHLLPFYPLAVEMLDLTGYDLIVSSDSGPVKGVVTDLGSTHVCYCHSPMRYLWDGHAAYQRSMSRLAQPLFGLASHYVRNWDYSAAQRVDHFVANSHYVAGRIRKYYRRDSVVIHPPIDTARGFLAPRHQNYYLAVGRLVAYKRTDLLIEACNQLGRKLVIVGGGPETKRLKKNASRHVEFLGEVDDPTLRKLYSECRALLFAADEDFGMVPLEAQSYGRPVIAYGKGGSLETVAGVWEPPGRPADDFPRTGVFFHQQTAESLIEAIRAFEASEEIFVPAMIREHAKKFDTAVFVENFRAHVDTILAQKKEADDAMHHVFGDDATPGRAMRITR